MKNTITLSISSVLWPSMNSSLSGLSMDIFFKGCKRHCPGCHNLELQTFAEPNHSVSEILSLIENTKTKVVTFMGGEPMDQPIESFLYLIETIRENFPEVRMSMYTGYELDEVDTRILDFLNDIKTGSYREDLRNKRGSFLASSNQKYFQKDEHGVFVEVHP